MKMLSFAQLYVKIFQDKVADLTIKSKEKRNYYGIIWEKIT